MPKSNSLKSIPNVYNVGRGVLSNWYRGGVLLLFSDALGLCPFGVGAYR